MRARVTGVIVAGGRDHVLGVEDFEFLERTMRAVGAVEIHTDGADGVAAQVENWARPRGMPVWPVTATWRHEGPATATERNTTLTGLARIVIAFPGGTETEALLTRARKRRLRIIESPSRLTTQGPTINRPLTQPPSGPRPRAGICP